MAGTDVKPMREMRIDLSRLTEDQLRRRELTIELGRRVFGERWQTDFALALSAEAGRHVGQNQVSQWISGNRPVPETLMEPMQRLSLKLADDLKARARDIHELVIHGFPGRETATDEEPEGPGFGR